MECDKFLINSNEIRGIDIRQTMKELNKEVRYGTDTIKLVLQFPDETQDTFLIQKEIKTILINELQEKIKSLTS